MKCNEVRENLIELLTAGPADPRMTAHLSQCGDCTRELASLRKTMSLLFTNKLTNEVFTADRFLFL
jgi:hypothetical protein